LSSFSLLKTNRDNRILGNQLILSDSNEKTKSFLSDNLEPCLRVFKIGRTTGYIQGIVNYIGIMTWRNGSIAYELAIITVDSQCFADKRDSKSHIISVGQSCKAVGFVVVKNDSDVPRWVAVTPLCVILEVVENTIEVELKLCSEFTEG